MSQWYESQHGLVRLQREKSLVNNNYRSISFDTDDEENVVMSGYLGPSNVLKRRYFIRGTVPKYWGNGTRIQFFLPYETLPGNTPHVYPDGEICVEHDDVTPLTTFDDEIGWVVSWLALFEKFLETGERW